MSGWAITGMGAVASIGDSPDEILDRLCAGSGGLAPLRAFDRSRFLTQSAYEIDDREPASGDRPGRATAWLVRAIRQAIDDAGLVSDLEEIPVVIGTGLRELRSLELAQLEDRSLTARELDFAPALRAALGLTKTSTIVNACSASLYALALGADLLDLGEADTVVVAGVDGITASMFGLLDRVQLTPPDAVRPFDRDRVGVIMGEAAAAIVLERRPRDAIHARLRSVGLSSDGRHPTAPDPAGIAAAMTDAHRRAGLSAQDVDLVVAHGTGTVLNDAAEATALSTVFGAGSRRPLVTAIKSMTGHTSGSSGLLSTIVAARALRDGRVPAIVGLQEACDEAATLDLVRASLADADLTVAQVDAFGFGGVNAVALLERERAA